MGAVTLLSFYSFCIIAQHRPHQEGSQLLLIILRRVITKFINKHFSGSQICAPILFRQTLLTCLQFVIPSFQCFDATECLFSGFVHITCAHATEHTFMKLEQGSWRNMKFYFLKIHCIALFCNHVEIISMHITNALLVKVLFECCESFL